MMIITSDDQRDDQMKVMTRTRQAFDNAGTKFTNGYVTTPLCCPSRSSILTGLVRPQPRGLRQPRRGPLSARDLDPARAQARRLHERRLRQVPERLAEEPDPAALRGLEARLRREPQVRRSAYRGQRAELHRAAGARRRRAMVRGLLRPRPAHSTGPDRQEQACLGPEVQARESYLERNLTDKPGTVRRKAFEQQELVRRVNPRKRWRQQLRVLLGLDEQIGKTVTKMKRLGESRDTLVFYLSDNGYLLGGIAWSRRGRRTESRSRSPSTCAGRAPSTAAPTMTVSPPTSTSRRRSTTPPGSHRPTRPTATPCWAATVATTPSPSIATAPGTGLRSSTRIRATSRPTEGLAGQRHDREFYDLVADPFEMANLFATEDVLNLASDPSRDPGGLRDCRPHASAPAPTAPSSDLSTVDAAWERARTS